jgi:hypothetical protein
MTNQTEFKQPFSISAPLISAYVENKQGTGHIWIIKPPIFHVWPFNMGIYGKLSTP